MDLHGLKESVMRILSLNSRVVVAEAEKTSRETGAAADRLVRAVDRVFDEHKDPIAWLVHRNMDHRRATKRDKEIG